VTFRGHFNVKRLFTVIDEYKEKKISLIYTAFRGSKILN